MMDEIDYANMYVGETHDDLDPFDELRLAIIKQAAVDYRHLFRRRLYGFPISPTDELLFDETEQFFYSKRFDGLVNISGEYIMNRIAKEELEKKHKLTQKQKEKIMKRVEKEWKKLNEKKKSKSKQKIA